MVGRRNNPRERPSIARDRAPDGWRPGGAKGSRTPDLLNAIQALSQLSYGPGRVEGGI
jgi:hypothetical protein